MFPIFNIGPVAVQAPGLIVLIGLWIWFTINDRFSAKRSIDPGILSNILFYSLIIGLVGSRIAFFIQSPNAFVNNPLSILSPNLALFDFPSGILISILVFFIFTQRNKLSLLKILDVITPGILVFFAFIALSLLASGKLYGLPSNLPWSIYLWGTLRHPLQIYYLVLFLMGAVFVANQLNKPYPSGTIFFIGIVISAFIILFLEAFRGSPIAIVGSIHIPQIIALFVMLIAMRKIKFSNPEQTNKTEINS